MNIEPQGSWRKAWVAALAALGAAALVHGTARAEAPAAVPPAPSVSAPAAKASATSAPPASAPAAPPVSAPARSELSAADAAVLREAVAQIEPIAASSAETDDTRCQALAALERLHEALGDWDRPGLSDWYMDMIKQARGRFLDELLKGGQTAARGGRYHLGGAHDFWVGVLALVEEQGPEAVARVEKIHKGFESRIVAFDKPRRAGLPNLKPLAIAVRRYNVTALLKPLAEPKPESPRKFVKPVTPKPVAPKPVAPKPKP